MKKSLLILSLLLTALISSAHEDILLNDGWAYRPISDPNWTVKDVPVTLPHTWNANYVSGTYYNRETMVYSRELEVTKAMQDRRLFLYFEGVNSVADVYVNRQTVGLHKGGYTAFCLEITDAVKPGENDLQVWVSNAFRTDVLPISGDFNVYGGIHRPCHLIVTEQDCISPLFYASPGVLVHQDKVSEQQAEITVETILSLKSGKQGLHVRTSVLDAQGKVIAIKEDAAKDDHLKQPITIIKPTLWNGLKNPYLYSIKVELLDGSKVIDEQTVQTGFRYFSVDKDKGFFLNGQHYDLHGFNRHEDVKGKGSALTQEDYDLDMQLIKESGATMLRLAHYPHAEPIYRLCDQEGMVVWSEIPMCGPGGYNFTGYLHNPGFEDNARQAALEMVYQKFNHPSVCFWGIFNEILVTDTRFKAYDNPVGFVKEINGLYKQTDPSRLATFATCVPHTHYLGCSDLIAWNKYFRRPGNEQQVRDFYDEARQTAGGQPLGISEYGDAGSIYQHYDPLYDKARTHAENYQTLTHEGYWRAIKDSEWLWCKTIWQFSDMQTSIRHEGDRDGMNDKGMVTYDRKAKKDVFYFYKANWTREPMLYLTDKRFTERTHAVTDIKAYGNVAEATLFVNNRKIGTAKRDDICRLIWPKVTLLEGNNQIRIEYRKGKTVLADTCTWHLQETVPEAIAPIEAPFAMPQLQRPVFPKRSFVTGENIQKAIDDLAAQGGGTVIVPKGKWQTGRITLRSNINLHLEKGAELHFSGEVADYQPAVLTRYEGIDMYSLGAMVYANGAENIALTGKGKLVAPPRDCEISRQQDGSVSESINDIPLEQRIFDGRDGQKTFMPLFFGPMYCKNVLVEGVTFEQSLFWNIAPTYCENIIIRDVTVNSFGVGRTDGIDIDSSVNTLIEYVTLDCGDDCFTLKSGRSYDGVRKNRPTENVVIRHCRVKRGVGGIAIGSETAAMIRNVYMHDCVMEDAKFPVFIKTRRPRGGGSENVWLERIHIQRTENAAFYWDMLGSPKWVGELANRLPARTINELTPVFRNFHFKDITIDRCSKLVSARGLPERPITDVTFENIQSSNRTMTMIDTDNWTFK
jgi:beta-galactosidase